MTKDVLGIDISKAKFDVALHIDGKFKFKKFNNNFGGFESLTSWLTKHQVTNLHACMEATGNYGESLAVYLHNAGFAVSVVNPSKIKGFSQCQLSRTKTDKADARLIAGFCRAMNPSLWKPKPTHIRELQQWVRRLESLQRMRLQECNRMGVCHSEDVKTSLVDLIAAIDAQIEVSKTNIERIIIANNDLQSKRKLLESIPGIGETTISLILGFFGNPDDFVSAKELSAFLGLNPRQNMSGSSINKRARISKTGDAKLRKALYMPALVAIRHNPIIKEFSQKLISNGKSKMAVNIAAMRKLVHIIYGVLKHSRPFDPAWQPSSIGKTN